MVRTFFLLWATLLLTCLSFSNVQSAPTNGLSDWKLPLPAGSYLVIQGDQDSCYWTHCRNYPFGNQNTYCAIDLGRRRGDGNIAGVPVLAPASGKVIDVGYQQYGGGNYVYILHDDGLVSHYEHLMSVYVKVGDVLKQGQPIGRVGATGGNWEPHLHFTVKTGRYGTCVKLTALDGNTNFQTGAIVRSTNIQVGTLPNDLPVPISPAPPIPTLSPTRSSNRPPYPPILQRPTDWSVFQGYIPELCAQAAGDPDGDLVQQYRFEIFESAQNWDSGWVDTPCVKPSNLGFYNYQWRARVRDARGLESDWSQTWHFSLVSPATATVVPTHTSTAVPSPTVTFTSRPTFTFTPLPFVGNVAPLCARIPDGINSNYAFDGILSTFWVNGLGHRFNLELRLPYTLPVSRILIWDRPQNSPDNNQINEVVLRLSNGKQNRFDMNSQGARCVDVILSTPQFVSSVFIIADNASGNNGLSEVEIWVGSKTSSLSCANQKIWP